MNRAWLVLPALILLACLLPLADGFTDDGYIHIQYARNLIERGEYSFNPGETSFGTSSPLWVMELATLGKVFGSGEELVASSRFLSWLAGFAALYVFYRLMLALGARRFTAVAATCVFAADAWFVRWTALSMETSTAALAVLLMALASVGASDNRRKAGLLGVTIVLASMVRPEVYLAFPVFAVTVASLFVFERRVSWGNVATTLAVAALLIAPWFIFAKLHIGSFLPYTAGAKSGGVVTSPLAFFAKFGPVIKIVGTSQAVAVIGGLLSLFVVGRANALFSRNNRFLTLWLFALPVAYVVFDIQILSRYLLLVTPVLCALGFRGWEQVLDRMAGESRANTLLGGAAATGIVASVLFYLLVVVPPSRAFTQDLTANMRGIAEYLDDNASPDAVVAAADIGYLAFFGQRRVLDLGGLVEVETGKLRAQYDYEEIVDRGLYLNVPGYPRVDYFIDRDLEPDRFAGVQLAGSKFEKVYGTVVRNLGIRKPGPYYYVLYRLTPVAP